MTVPASTASAQTPDGSVAATYRNHQDGSVASVFLLLHTEP